MAKAKQDKAKQAPEDPRVQEFPPLTQDQLDQLEREREDLQKVVDNAS